MPKRSTDRVPQERANLALKKWWWRSGWATLLAVVATAVAAFVLAGVFTVLLSKISDGQLRPSRISDRKIALSDILKLSFAMVAGIGGAAGLALAHRKQCVSERDEWRANDSVRMNRFQAAADQLGHESAAVRMIGLYRMSSLSDDFPSEPTSQQQFVDVICAYMRLPLPDNTERRAEEVQVRRTALDVIRARVQKNNDQWSDCEFDFTGATFDGGSLERANFRKTVLFFDCNFVKNDFRFTDMVIDADIRFRDSKFLGGDIRFDKSDITSKGRLSFLNVEFATSVCFADMKIEGTPSASASAGSVTCGKVEFKKARFTENEVTFHNTEVQGLLTFAEASFKTTVRFRGLKLRSGCNVDFSDATFTRGDVRFDLSEMEGGTLKFDGATIGTISGTSLARLTFGPAKLRETIISFYGEPETSSNPESPIPTGLKVAKLLPTGLLDFGNTQFLPGRIVFNQDVFKGGKLMVDSSSLTEAAGAIAGIKLTSDLPYLDLL